MASGGGVDQRQPALISKLDSDVEAASGDSYRSTPIPFVQHQKPEHLWTVYHSELTGIETFEEKFEAAFTRFGGAQRYATCSQQTIRRHAISSAELLTAIMNIDLIVWVTMMLSCALTYLCIEYEIYWNIQVGLIISAIVFPLAFSINESYRRREKVLDDMASFMGAASELYWLHREWTPDSKLPSNHVQDVEQDINDLLINLIHYVATEIPDAARSQRLGAVYRIFSRLAQCNDLMRTSELTNPAPLLTRLVHYHAVMVSAFERMRVVREYRTPRGIRGYTKMIVFFLPIILAPYFAFQARDAAMRVTEYRHRNPANEFYEDTNFHAETWSAYFSAIVCCLVFGSLQAVQDTLDDPFDGIGQDDIDLHLVTSWAPSALWQNPEDQRIPVLENRHDDFGCKVCGLCPTTYTVVHAEPEVPDDVGGGMATLPPAVKRATNSTHDPLVERRLTGYSDRAHSGFSIVSRGASDHYDPPQLVSEPPTLSAGPTKNTDGLVTSRPRPLATRRGTPAAITPVPRQKTRPPAPLPPTPQTTPQTTPPTTLSVKRISSPVSAADAQYLAVGDV